MNIYVANISYSISENDIRNAFEAYGPVSKVKIVKDRDTGKSKGFGFVEMENENDGDAAINALNGAMLAGRELKVKVAFPRRERV